MTRPTPVPHPQPSQESPFRPEVPPLGEDGWRLLVEQVKDYAIFMIGPDGRNVSWNEGVGRVLGYREAEFLGDRMSRVFTPEDQAAGVPERELEQARREGRANDDRWMMRKDGTRFWASGMTTALRDEERRLVGFTKVLRDLTEEKRLDEERRAGEQRLHESEHRLLTALTAARMGTWQLDLATNTERFDEGLNRLFGARAGEIATFDDFLARIHPDDRGAVATAFRHSADSGVDLDLEFRVVRPDGSVRWLRDHGKVLYDLAGDPVALTGACVDITERRHAEDNLRQAQRMDAVGRLAGGVAHEVNNMMTAILGFTDLLLEPADGPDQLRSDLLQIRKAAGRAAMVTSQLLAFSRRQMLQPRVLDLNRLLGDLQPMLLQLLGEDKRLVTRLEPRLWPVHADRGQLEQVVINLALNARDAMPQGGRVSIESDNVVLDDDFVRRRHPGVAIAAGPYVRLVVSDTGTGIPLDIQSRIFEPFFTTKPVGQGTGLGLSMVYGNVKQSGGFVWVYSEPGHGTAFKVYLPRVAVAPEEPGLTAPGEIPRGRETVLVVEDDELVRLLATRLLATQGYTAMEARNGQEALELVRGRPGEIRLVLTDVVMPEVGGLEFARRLAELEPELPVLFMSGFTEEEVVRRGLLDPNAPYLQKPFDASTLGRRIREVLDAAAAGG
ncbi:MAG TPA: PAS domain S-box protein [Gemmatimonadales bacterium]|nr:PAS domain S-box protein [Gemmatimonadales bacterium]